MPPSNFDRAPAVSIAEAKLERQKRRIEEAEASLNAPHPLDRRLQASRGKGNKWKPFDFTTEATQANTPEGGVPVSEVRVSTFRAPSRTGSSLSRSMSVMSHRTNDTGPSDMERQDSALTEQGFQVYKGRRNRKNVGELSAYEDKPEERQKTVEATFDSRAIYNVFGNALPGPEFIEENMGFKNGQLQFVQHPNGDVSAHQWSNERYQWENIGQFSNIRKKVEGQLGSDRLKGETAYQTLQQNTLSYFRIIAKQREANVMGLPFGTKEIQAAIPEPRVELAAAPPGLKDATHDTNEFGSPQKVSDTPEHQRRFQSYHQFLHQELDNQYAKLAIQTADLRQQLALQNAPQAPRGDRYSFAPNYGPQSGRQDDPFYSSRSFQQIYGGYPGAQAFHGQASKHPAASAYPSNAPRGQGLNYDFHFPPPNPPNRSQVLGWPPYHAESTNTPNRAESQRQQPYHDQTSIPSYPQYQGSHAGSHDRYTSSDRTTVQPSNEIAAPQPQHPQAFNPRTAARDQLWKLPETAKERSLSQANIRTVLYDPFQAQRTAAQAKQEEDPVKQDVSPTFAHNNASNTLQPPKSYDPNPSKFFPTVLAPRQQSSPTRSSTENNLRDSSPDPYQNKPSYMHGMPLITTSSESKPTPQILNGPFFGGDHDLRSSLGSSSVADREAQDEQLRDWWTSGNKFARQEEFFQSIQSARGEVGIGIGSSPAAHLTPIGPPKKSNNGAPQANDTMTRLLIPVLENLASYVQGPVEKRRDYFSQWSKPPEWCVDRSEGGNDSFFDKDWGTPPARGLDGGASDAAEGEAGCCAGGA
ncbi:hypothetical protein LTR37_010420 [Vermiconidia calcicola]|uniref:Uncharacterized protein n=1 Tax=Vermiconidia calcicola TaxID=1690605 RepID=A0ACC3N5J4_9PEZI|nr:hypothetical protein LTR37_010420 [Vermiconidia calcicola]